jgi:hypothetical protein
MLKKNFFFFLKKGYVGYFQEDIGANLRLDYFLISRRSRHNAGTRFNSRGIDYEGKATLI